MFTDIMNKHAYVFQFSLNTYLERHKNNFKSINTPGFSIFKR